MAKALTKPAAGLPAHLQKLLGGQDAEIYNEYSGGVKSGFPVISYRGKVWRVKAGGEEQINVDENGDARQSIELVLLKSNPIPSKIHYDKQYTEGDDAPPRCWSANGIAPDKEVVNPINPVCGNCPKNQWGSRITEAGKKSRACSDVRRMAVVFADQLAAHAANGSDLTTMLLRVPPASLNPLKEYVEKTLKPKGVPPFVLVTRLGFDNEAAYPKITFKPARFLTEPEATVAVALRDSDDVHRILDESIEYSPEESTEVGDESGAAASAAPAEAKASASSGASKKAAAAKKRKAKKAATAAEAEAAAAAAVVAVEADEEDDDPMAALMAGAAESEEEAEEDADEEAEEDDEASESDDFDDMLDKLLAG